MSIDFKKIIEEHNRFAKMRSSHVLKQILLSDLLKNLFGIELEDIFLGLEKNVKSTVKGFRGKTDLLYQNIIFEVKIDLDRELEDGKQQLKKYFQALHESDPSLKSVGLITDCIKFIQYVPIIKDEVEEIREISSIDLLEDNSKDIILWLDSILFSKTQILPDADDLKFRFGLGSPTYTYMLQGMEDAWGKVKDSESMNIKLRLWKNHMEIVYGRAPTERSFLEQTYLVVLVKLLLYLRIYGSYDQSQLDVLEVLTGQYFRTFGISNLVEEGYYSWILDSRIYSLVKSSLEALLRELTRYDTAKISEDLFKEIYQEIVRKEDRHRVGEYYTPEWLAEVTLNEAFIYHQSINPGEIPSIFDPACGSGTFLTNAIHLLRNHFFKKDSARALNVILEKVAGADINPLAVYIARANYIFALGDLLGYKQDIISIPVYVADTFKPEAVEDIQNAPKQVYEIDADGDKLWIPSSILEDHMRFKETIERLEKAVLTYTQAGKKRDLSLTSFREKSSRFTQKENEILEKTLNTLFDLIDQERNSVWLFVLSNTLAPLVFQKRKLDIIAGNPPWIAMRFMENVVYQDYIKSRVFSFGLIDTQEIQLFSNMEMATVFFNSCIERYLKENGIIAFVMPRSILTGALQHARFKEFRNPKVKLTKILDFENVTPLFRVPSCTILGVKGKDNSYPVPLQVYSGAFESRNLRLAKAELHLRVREGAYTPAATRELKSHYYDKFKMGARLAPRPFWFVDFVSHPILKINPRIPRVKTTRDSRREAKGQWDKVELEGNIESDYIFATLLSKDLLPFGYANMRPVVIPAELREQRFSLLDVENLRKKDSANAADWLTKVESFWKEYRSIKDEKNFPSVLDRVDYQKLLTVQDPRKRFILLYVASGTYIIASVVDRNEIPDFRVDHTIIKPKGFVAESKTWFLESDNEDEVHYLCSILNSTVLSKKVHDLQTRGLWGARDIHRRPLWFNILSYQEADGDHKRLGEISRGLHKTVPKIRKLGNKKGISAQRRKIQEIAYKELKEIDELVKKILHFEA